MAVQDRQLGLTGGVAIKAVCYVASTANITLSSTQVVDGISVGSSERVLVKNQTNTKENGIYVATSSAWTRAKDFDGNRDAIPGSLVYVDRGTAYGKTFWAFNSSSTASAIDIGTTQVTVSQVTQALSSAPLTTRGDVLIHDTSAAVRLALGTTSQVLTSDGTDVSWGTITANSISSSAVVAAGIASSAVTGPKIAMGSDAQGDLLVRGSTAYSRLAKGSSDYVLRGGATSPEWAAAAPLRGHIDGLTLSNDGTDAAKDIGISAGEATDDGNAVTMVLGSALIKKLDAAWAVGTNQGALDGTESVTGTPDASTWYHIWLIRRSDTGVVDILASESATAPTMPTNYDQKRRIGAVLFDATPDILAFSQDGDEFYWSVPVNDLNNGVSTAGALVVCTVPTGINVMARVQFTVDNAGAGPENAILTSPDQANTAPSASVHTVLSRSPGVSGGGEVMRTDTSGQLRYRLSDAGLDAHIITQGWIDPRGRNA